MELSSKLRRLEESLKTTKPLKLMTQGHVRVPDMPRTNQNIHAVLEALIQTEWPFPSLAMPTQAGILLQWDFGLPGFLTFVCESQQPGPDLQLLYAGMTSGTSMDTQ